MSFGRIASPGGKSAAGRPDLVALEYPAIAFEGFHQRACFALFRGAALAVAIDNEPGLPRIESFGTGRKTVSCQEAEIQRLLALDPLKLRHDSGQRAYVLSNASDRLRRRHCAMAATGRNSRSTNTEPDRCRRAQRVPQGPVTASGALRPCCHIVPVERRTQQVQADDMLVQVGAEAADNR